MSLNFFRYASVALGLGPTHNGFGLPDEYTYLIQKRIIDGESRLSFVRSAERRLERNARQSGRQFAGIHFRAPDETDEKLPSKVRPKDGSTLGGEELKEYIDQVKEGKRYPIDIPLGITAPGILAPGFIAFICVAFFNGFLGLDFVQVTNWYFYIVGSISFIVHLFAFFGLLSVRDYLARPAMVLTSIVMSFIMAMLMIGSFFSLYENLFSPTTTDTSFLLKTYRDYFFFFTEQAATSQDIAFQIMTAGVIWFAREAITDRQK